MTFWKRKRINEHSLEVLKKGGVAFALKISGAGLAFVLQLIIARHLGASDTGIYYLALTIITVAATISRLGMDNSVTRFVAAQASEQNFGKVKGVVRVAAKIALGASLGISALLYVLSEWVSITIFAKPVLTDPLRYMALMIVPLSMMTIIAKALQGLKRIRDAMLTLGVIMPLTAIGVLWFVSPGVDLVIAVTAYGIGVVFAFAYSSTAWHQSINLQKATSAYSARTLLSVSLPLLGGGVLELLMQSLPLLLLGVWGSSADTGLFSTAQRTAGLVGLVLVAANSIIAPKFSELFHRGDLVSLGKVARHGALIVTAMAFPILMLFIIFPQAVMGMYGNEFVGGWLLLVILSLGQIVNVMTGSVGFLLMMTGNEKSFLWMNLQAFLLNAGLCIALIPTYGATGAAIATAASLAAVNILRVGFIWRRIGIKVLPF